MPHHAPPFHKENFAKKHFAPGLVLGLLALAGCGPTDRAGAAAPVAPEPRTVALTAFRGDFERRLPLSGEIDAVAAVELKGPRVPTGKSPLRFLAAEGAEVKAGDVVAELDSSSFVAEIKDRSLQLSQAEIDLQRQISQNGVLDADRALDVERKRAAVERAVVDADLPEGILPNREYLEKQLVLRRVKVDLEKAQEALALGRRSAESDLAVKRIAIEKLRRAMNDAERAVGSLTLRAPEAGTVIIADHPEERRKLQEGDDVFMGMTVARVASSRARRVRAVLIDVDDGKIASGMPARVVLDAHPEQSFAGVVRDIAPVARTPGDTRGAQRRIFTVNVDLNDAEAALLRPGLSARVEVLLQRQTQVLLAPRTAIDWGASETRARLPGRKFAAVKVGECNREVCVIETGLQEGTILAGGRS
jgi:HlyD family secretion protein